MYVYLFGLTRTKRLSLILKFVNIFQRRGFAPALFVIIKTFCFTLKFVRNKSALALANILHVKNLRSKKPKNLYPYTLFLVIWLLRKLLDLLVDNCFCFWVSTKLKSHFKLQGKRSCHSTNSKCYKATIF